MLRTNNDKSRNSKKNNNDDNDARTIAISKFKESIAQANKQGVVNEEALANERFGIAMMEWDEVTQALEYFERAKSLYEQWGSPVKVTQLVKFVQEKSGVTMSTTFRVETTCNG